MPIAPVLKPVDEQLRDQMVAYLKDVLTQAEKGELDALVVVEMSNNQFRIRRRGNLRRTQVIGFLMQAVVDLATTE